MITNSIFSAFDLEKYRKILYPLIIIILLSLCKSLTSSIFPINSVEPTRLNGLFSILGTDLHSPVQKLTTHILDIFVFIVLFSWEAYDRKNWRKIGIILLFTIPQLIIQTIGMSSISEPKVLLIWTILYVFISPCAIYGLIRNKILRNTNLSITGYVVGVVVSGVIGFLSTAFIRWTGLNILHYILPSALFCLLYFYLLFLTDKEPKLFKIFKPQHVVFLNKSKFTFHFILLFLFLFILFSDSYGLKDFYPTNNFYFIGNILFVFIKSIIPLIILYFLFSRLLLEQLDALSQKPLWAYILSFVPLINLYPLLYIFRNPQIILNDAEQAIRNRRETRNRIFIQITVVVLVIVFVMKVLSLNNLTFPSFLYTTH